MRQYAWIIACIFVLLPQIVCADGAYIPRLPPHWKAQREQTLINEPEQKAAILFRNGQEQLIISPSYSGQSNDFAWVVPVPSRPQVKIIHGALFHELENIVEPAPPPRRPMPTGRANGAMSAPRPPVVVLERKTVGAYDVSVLSATDGGALQRWLHTNGYLLPSSAKRPLAGYVREHWTFVACRIKVPGNAQGLRQGVLAPLSLTFPSQNLVYPMRLSSVNPRPFHVLLYLLQPQQSGRLLPVQWPHGVPPQLQYASVSATASYPTLAQFHENALNISWFSTTIAPKDCVYDYVFHVVMKPGR